MRYLNRLILIIIIFFTFISASISKENIAFVNVDYLIQNSNIGKKLLADINKKDKKNLDDLKKKNKILQDLELSIKKKKNVISNEAYNKEVNDFKKKFQEFSIEKNKIVKEFNIFKKKQIENIFKKINPIINNYMDENSINLLFDSKKIFMGTKKLNLTKDILKKINNELK
ncbi:OmpH family outer membrane protein [Pelagibacterales bacterium SAG-MED21]|nr:OmpH family outer membrane protein [Pelagibacterales bacterium SAG-MED21]